MISNVFSQADEKRAQLPLKAADCGPFSILGITLENQTSNFMKGEHFALQCYVLPSPYCYFCPKFSSLRKSLDRDDTNVWTFSDSEIDAFHNRTCTSKCECIWSRLSCSSIWNAFRSKSIDRRSIQSERFFNISQTSGQSQVSPNSVVLWFRTLLKIRQILSSSLPIYDRDRVGAILSIATMRELISAAARKFHSAIRNALEANPYPLMSGNSDEWLSYLLLLESTAEITEEEMRRTKHALHSIISILSKAKAESPEKPDLSCDERYFSFINFFVFANQFCKTIDS